MRYIILILLFASYAKSADFVLYRTNDGKMTMWPNMGSVSALPRYWDEEGGNTGGQFQRISDGIEINWKIDQIGPCWVLLDLRQTDDGIYVSARHDTFNWSCQNWYANYDDLYQSKDELASMVRVLMRRSGQWLSLPTENEILGFCDGIDKVPQEALEIVKRLDSDDWKVREEASCKMHDYARYINCLKDLTIEQSYQIDKLRGEYILDISSDFILFLRASNKVCPSKQTYTSVVTPHE